MKILFIGDIVGKPGRNIVKEKLPALIKKHNLDLVIANAENISHGKGVTPKTIEEMTSAGVDFFTSGNHVFAREEIIPQMNSKKSLILRPANFPQDVPGQGEAVIKTKKGVSVLVINLVGRVFFKENFDCPFRAADRILSLPDYQKIKVKIVDFHAEATSEKQALGYYLGKRVSAVLGTHTHIPTADDRILSGQTAYVSDVGMCGLSDSILGIDKESVIEHFLTQLPFRHEITPGPAIFNSVLVVLDEKTGKAEKIERVDLKN